jgi:hypothetical protein
VCIDSFPKHPFAIDIKLYILKVSVFDVVASMYVTSVISNSSKFVFDINLLNVFDW